MILEVDKAYIVAEELIKNAEGLLRGKCLYQQSAENLLDLVQNLRITIELCIIPPKKKK